MIAAMLVMFGFLFIQEQTAVVGSWTYYIIVFFIGVITAISIIIPGLSGATMLMAFGYFQTLINLGGEIIDDILAFNFSSIAGQLPMLLLLVLGVIIGLLFMGKVMYQLLIHYKVHFYFAVLGIVFISPFNILFTLQTNTSSNVFHTSWYIWVIGAIMFILGMFITYMISKRDLKEEAND